MKTPNPTENIFFKYAICSKCNKEDKFCKCDIGSPCLMLFQWYKAIKETEAKCKAEFLDILDKRINYLKNTFPDDDLDDELNELEEIKQSLIEKETSK